MFFLFYADGGLSEEFELLTGSIGWHFFFAYIEFDVGELFVGNGEAAHLSVLGQERADSFEVDFGVLAAGAVAHVDGELEHGETVGQEVLSEVGGGFAFLFGVGGEVEENEQPHDAVF